MRWLFENDICWCADSNKCGNTGCFRHLNNKSSDEKIFTCGWLMDTEYCPLVEYIEDEKILEER